MGYQIYFDVNWVDGSHQLSDVDVDGNGTTATHTFTTAFPDSAARFKALFALSSTPSTPTPPASAPSASVRVTNPGFEAGQIGWHLYGSATTMLPGPHAGRLVLHLGGARGGAEQDLISQLEVGGSYKVNAYARLENSSDEASIGAKFFNSGGSVISESYQMVTSTDYGLYSVQFTVPVHATVGLVYAYKPNGVGGALFDDYEVVPVP